MDGKIVAHYKEDIVSNFRTPNVFSPITAFLTQTCLNTFTKNGRYYAYQLPNTKTSDLWLEPFLISQYALAWHIVCRWKFSQATSVLFNRQFVLAKDMERYMAGATDMEITYPYNLTKSEPLRPIPYAEEDWGGCKDTIRSTTAITVKQNSASVHLEMKSSNISYHELCWGWVAWPFKLRKARNFPKNVICRNDENQWKGEEKCIVPTLFVMYALPQYLWRIILKFQ